MEKNYAGLDARHWNRMYHAALAEYKRYRAIVVVETAALVVVVLAVMLAVMIFR